jgi:hypothetical protein
MHSPLSDGWLSANDGYGDMVGGSRLNPMRAILLACVLLCACATRADRIANDYVPNCQRMGYKAGTPEFSNCVQNLLNSDEAAMAQRKAAASALGAAILANQPRPPQPQQPIICQRRSSDGSIVICQ